MQTPPAQAELRPSTPLPNGTRLTLLGFCLLLFGLAALRPMAVPDEGRYGEIGRWMLLSGDWLTPRLNGLPFFHKPPLTHWLQALSLGAFGVSTWALRLVPVVHAGLMLWLVAHLGQRLASPAVAQRAVWMLGSSLGFLIAGQYINHDMVVATWIALAIAAFALSLMAGAQPDAALARWGFVACALAVLAKGLIGLALPGLVLVVWVLWSGRLAQVWRLPWLSGVALFAVIATPWFVLAQRKFADFFHYLFIGQQFQRYTATGYNNPQPWWFYGAALLLLMGPGLLFVLAQRRHLTPATPALRLPIGLDAWRLLWAWLGAITVFFSIPQSKLVGYILPVLPAVALLAALGWQRAMAHRTGSGRAFVVLIGVNLALAVGVNQAVGPVTASSRSADVAAALACAAAPGDRIAVANAYPYDLPFLVQTPLPLIVLGDWPRWRREAGDSWMRELFEGADFDPAAGTVLQDTGWIRRVAGQPGHWLVLRRGDTTAPVNHSGWQLFFQGAGWAVWQTKPALPAINSESSSVPERPPTRQHVGLPGCHDQGRKQSQP